MNRRRAIASYFWLLAVALIFLGCSPPSGELYVADWQLDVDGAAKGAVTLPAHLGLAPHDLEFRLRRKIVLPPRDRGRALVLVIPYLSAPVVAKCAGEPLVALGEPAVNVYRDSAAHSWSIPAELTRTPELDLEIVVQRRWSHADWLDTVPRITSAGTTDPQASLVHLVNRVGAACGTIAMFQIGITYLVVFLVDRRRKAYLWFALQGITAAYYPLFILGYTQRILGRADVAALAFLISAAPIASVYFTHAHFGLGKPSRAWPFAMAVATVTVVVAHGPYSNLPMQGTVAVVSAAVVYQLVTAARLVMRRDRPGGALFLLACWTGLGATAWTDIVYWANVGDLASGARWACVGLTLFALLQSLMLSSDHSQTLLRADELNAALGERVDLLESRQREIEQLNAELQRQIADRSKQLAEAIARIGARRAKATELAPGDVVEDRYRVVRVLGSGGMGTVYEVERTSDRRHLALKITTNGDELFVARLAREAQIAAGVAHPNVVGIVDVDVASSGVLFLVMEYVAGKSLHEYREHFGDASWALAVLRQVAQGLSALHDSGIVHRDLKPANILLSDGGQGLPLVKITDFGVSSIQPSEPAASTKPTAGPDEVTAVGRPDSPPKSGSIPPLTEVGALVGTPRYLAPEVALGRTAGPEADVFAFGIIAFETLTKRYPFAELPMETFLLGRPLEPIAALESLCPTLPPDLTTRLKAALDSHPDQRPAARVLADELEKASRA